MKLWRPSPGFGILDAQGSTCCASPDFSQGMHAAMPDHDPTGRLLATVERLGSLIEGRLLPVLERLEAALERLEAGGGLPGESGDSRGELLAALHEALRQRDWLRVTEHTETLVAVYPNDPETVAVVAMSHRRREEAAVSLQGQLAASRETNDTAAVLALRDELVGLLDPASRQELDQELVRWLLKIIQRRMRTGTVAVDVAQLAAEVAGRFGGTREGASLRASLPTLRRSAGLCPRCGEPYDGLEDACPRCLPGGSATVTVIPVTLPESGDSGANPPPAP